MNMKTLALTIAPLAVSAFDMQCPDGMLIPPMNLQMLYVHDMVSFKTDLRTATRSSVGKTFTAVREAFGENTQTALATFVDKMWDQNNDPNFTWCYRRELEFAADNAAAADTTMTNYGMELYRDYNERDSQADVVYIALRRDGEYGWNKGDFGENGNVNIRIIMMATDQQAMYYNGALVHEEKPMWSDAATEDCNNVNYPTKDQMNGAIAGLPTYFVFQTADTYNATTSSEYGLYPNSVVVPVDVIATEAAAAGRDLSTDIIQATLDAIKDLLCDVVTYPCPEEVIPVPATVCACQILEDTIRKFNGTC